MLDQLTAESLELEWQFMSNTHTHDWSFFYSCNDSSVSCLTHSQIWSFGVFLVLFFSKLSMLDLKGCCHNFSDIMIVSSSRTYFTHSVYSSCRTKWHRQVVVYFESFLFIHIYIFTKNLIQHAPNRNNLNFKKRGISETNSHTRNRGCVSFTFHTFTLCKILTHTHTQLYLQTHTHTHTYIHTHTQS